MRQYSEAVRLINETYNTDNAQNKMVIYGETPALLTELWNKE